MATDTHKYEERTEQELPHSIFEEFNRDERRPAVLLLSALVIAAIFFAVGVMVGRWIGEPAPPPTSAPEYAAGVSPAASGHEQASPAPLSNSASTLPTLEPERRFALLIATFQKPEDAQPLVRELEQGGYTEIRISTPRADDRDPGFSVLVGRFTQAEAMDVAARLRATGNSKLKDIRVVEDSSD